MQNFDEKFNEIFNKLNKEQQKAVETIDGPVMVIAGPGTGKTQILASRILNIIKQDDCRPENILCLTYTDAGATNMRQRLSEFMGTESYKVNIHTFHSLCNRLISERPDLYSKRELRVMDDLERLEIFQSMIDQLPHHSPLKDYASYNQNLNFQLQKTWTILRELQVDHLWLENEIKQLKDPEKFKEIFPDLIYKRNTAEAQKGDIKVKDQKILFDSWEKLLEAAKLYPQYIEKKLNLGVYEFSDMLDWVHDRLKTDEEYKLSLQEKFLYVLVDEFQDTSYQQGEILRLLTDYWGDRANCFVVGDDDQSIYAFQGARVGNMIEFKQRFANTLTTIVLTQNYRSSQAILNGATALISHNKLRLVNTEAGLKKELISSGNNREYANVEPQIRYYQNEFHEVLGITDQIQELIKSGVKPSDIALIYSKHRFAEGFIELFRERDIPFLLNKSIDILKEPIIDLVIRWLTYLNDELKEPHSGESDLYELLASEMYVFRPMNLNRLSAEIYKIKQETRKQDSIPYSWRLHLQLIKEQKIHLDYLSEEETNTLIHLFDCIENWVKKVATLNLSSLISQLFTEFGFIQFATKDPNSYWQLEVLHTFLSYVNQQCERLPFIELSSLLNQIETLKTAQIEIPIEKRMGISNGIQMFSAHGSKGLEFDHVFIIQCMEKEWNSVSMDSLPFKLRTLFEAVKGPIQKEESQSQLIEERRRLFFVAATRAKKTLTLSYFARKLVDKNDSLSPTVFLGELVPSYFQSDIKKEILKKEDLIWTQKQILLQLGEPFIENNVYDWIEERVQKFVFSPSSIQSILKCGLSFFYGHIVRVPSSPNEYLSYGNAMHACMRNWIEVYHKDKKWLSIAECQQYFEFQMIRMKGSFTEKQFESRLSQGKNILEKLIPEKQKEYAHYEKAIPEMPIQTEIRGVLLKGNIDKLITESGESYISDYKTGKIKNIRDKSRLSAKFKEGDIPPDYWLQLGIYALMVNAQNELNVKVNKGRIEALTDNDDGKFENIDIYYTKEHFDLIMGLIQQAQNILKNHEFLKGCGKENCGWCDFTKRKGMVRMISPEEWEE